jgi:hypothetical protein
LRIANLHGDTEEKQIRHLLLHTCHIRPVDVLLISSYQEIDTTRTMDVGLHNMEDGLWGWVFLHGVVVDERPMEVYPISSICGATRVLDVSGWTELDADIRVEHWSILASLPMSPPPQQLFEGQVDLFGQHMLMFGRESHEPPGMSFISCHTRTNSFFTEIPPFFSSLHLSQAEDLPLERVI